MVFKMWSEMFKSMSNLEKDYSKKLSDSAKDVKNPVVKIIMKSVAQDSLKHSLIYEALVEMLSGERPMLGEAEAEKIASEIEYHIKTEEEMIRFLNNALKQDIKDKSLKFLLESLLRDEIYHHALLKRVHEMIVKKETFTESDLWDLVWKEATFHGAPGG